MADQGAGEGGAFSQEHVDEAVREALAAAKAEQDTAFKNLWAEAKDAKARAKAFDGLDPDEVRGKLARVAELEQESRAKKAGITSEELDKLRTSVRADLEKEYSPYRLTAEQLSEENRELKLDNVVKALMGKHGVRGERVDALYRLTSDQWDLTEDGQPMLKKHPGREIDKYIADELGKEYPEFFLGSGSSGGGASRSAAGGGGNVRQIAADDQDSFMSNLDRIAKGEVRVAS